MDMYIYERMSESDKAQVRYINDRYKKIIMDLDKSGNDDAREKTGREWKQEIRAVEEKYRIIIDVKGEL